ncbi:MAG TPA: hypothetical protein VJW55_00625, partial [Candidatus Angelobacter sp.]|nr:hypothetical protein [Candidatus Angelobacter sp.]
NHIFHQKMSLFIDTRAAVPHDSVWKAVKQISYQQSSQSKRGKALNTQPNQLCENEQRCREDLSRDPSPSTSSWSGFRLAAQDGLFCALLRKGFALGCSISLLLKW